MLVNGLGGAAVKKGMTIMELVIVLVLISVIVMLTLPNYTTMQERAKDKEAIGILKRVQEAQKFYSLEKSTYYPPAPTVFVATLNSINLYLKLDLTTGANRDWDYWVYNSGCGRARRTASDNRNWYLNISDDGRSPGGNTTDGKPESSIAIPGYSTDYTCP